MKMRRTFFVSILVFGITLFILLLTSTIHGISPSHVDLFPGLRGLIGVLDRINGIDAFLSLLSLLASIVSGIVNWCRG